jgi:hypothetical protein
MQDPGHWIHIMNLYFFFAKAKPHNETVEKLIKIEIK